MKWQYKGKPISIEVQIKKALNFLRMTAQNEVDFLSHGYDTRPDTLALKNQTTSSNINGALHLYLFCYSVPYYPPVSEFWSSWTYLWVGRGWTKQIACLNCIQKSATSFGYLDRFSGFEGSNNSTRWVIN